MENEILDFEVTLKVILSNVIDLESYKNEYEGIPTRCVEDMIEQNGWCWTGENGYTIMKAKSMRSDHKKL